MRRESQDIAKRDIDVTKSILESFNQISILDKVPQQPEKVKIALGQVQTTGQLKITLSLDNFGKLKGLGRPGFNKINLWRYDEGQDAGAAVFMESVRAGTEAPVSANQIFEVERITLQFAEIVREQT